MTKLRIHRLRRGKNERLRNPGDGCRGQNIARECDVNKSSERERERGG